MIIYAVKIRVCVCAVMLYVQKHSDAVHQQFSPPYQSLCQTCSVSKRNKTEQIYTIIPGQATALCLGAPLPVGRHIITAATLIHHSIVVVNTESFLSQAQQHT